MQTVLMNVKQIEKDRQDGDEDEHEAGRRFLWTMQRERRPPRQNCWAIHEVVYVRNAFMLTT
jgi:hypothetical protein